MSLTLGQERVRITFNVNANPLVNEIKQNIADLIDQCNERKDLDPRVAAIAQTKLEDACHWAVKLVTTVQPTKA